MKEKIIEIIEKHQQHYIKSAKENKSMKKGVDAILTAFTLLQMKINELPDSKEEILSNEIKNDFLEQKFKELLYDLGERHFNIIKSEAWDKYINNEVKFNESQLDILRNFTKDIISGLNQ